MIDSLSDGFLPQQNYLIQGLIAHFTSIVALNASYSLLVQLFSDYKRRKRKKFNRDNIPKYLNQLALIQC